MAAIELESGKSLGEVMPALAKTTSVKLETFDAERLAEQCDVVFMALHGGTSMDLIPPLRQAGVKVIDMGPDFRLKNTADFKKYYGMEHRAPELLDEAVYGLAPYYRDQIATTSLVAVPGCYVMSVLFPVRPLVDGISRDFPVIVDAISGLSGAGRALHGVFHFPEMNENVRAYKLGVHQHTPEIEQELGGDEAADAVEKKVVAQQLRCSDGPVRHPSERQRDQPAYAERHDTRPLEPQSSRPGHRGEMEQRQAEREISEIGPAEHGDAHQHPSGKRSAVAARPAHERQQREQHEKVGDELGLGRVADIPGLRHDEQCGKSGREPQ
mgnify:CR=1 FL=1